MAAAVDDANAREAGERGVVDEGANGLARLLGALPAHVELVGHVAARGGDDLDRGLGLRLRAAATGRSRASGMRSRWPAAPTTSASSPSIAAIVPCTPSDGASTGSPAASGPVCGSGSVERADRRSARTARSEAAPSRRSRSGSSRRFAPRHPDLVAKRVELRARRSPDRPVPRPRRARARPRRTRAPPRSRPRAPARALGPRRAARRPPRARPPPPRAPRRRSARPPPPRPAAPRSAVVPARPRPRASATTSASRPSRSAICSACEMPGPPERDAVERRVRVGVEPGRRVGDVVGARSPTPSAPRSASSRPSAAPARRAGRAAPGRAPSPRPDPFPPRPRRAAPASARSRRRRIATRLATWPEKVERLISIDCRSPMSASTASKTGSAAVSAGGRSPDWCSSAARPSVFSATVLPPVFGPLITSARRPPRSRSIGTAVFGSSSGWRAPTSRTSSDTSTGAPRQPRERVPSAIARSIAAGGLDGGSERARLLADGGRQLAEDPLDLLALGAGGFRLAVAELDDLERLDEERLARVRGVVHDARARCCASSP